MGKFDGLLIVSDIDGTMTDDKQMLSKENKSAIEYFKQNGGIFTIATGRLQDYFREKEFDTLINCPAVLLNGAAVYDFITQEFLMLKCIDEDYLQVYDFIKSLGGFSHIHFNYKDGGFDVEACINRKDIPSKIVVACDNEVSAINIRDRLKKHFDGKYEIFRSWNTGVEVLPKGATKGNAIEFLKQRLAGVNKTAAIGDYENDISLIYCADISFVPENAVYELKQNADYIVSHDTENALKEMIEILDKMYKD